MKNYLQENIQESITQRILNGEKIYPHVNRKIVNIKMVYDLTEHYKRILNQTSIVNKLKENGYSPITDLKEFKKLLWEDISFLEIIKSYFNNQCDLLISDKDCEKIFAVDLKESEEKPYTLNLVQLYCELNRENFFNNYIDVFGNEIIFK